ncbi:hypothetical protein [Phocicoccus pinnipedialis]|uniref:Uncharacterized protein n=2 Tax=Phocicoccus pinnipedialis TaxID=110845 RepID=A0A6V7RNF8_9BACL|nr:hypothetical protein [Jeotgalicoccus pinnipedialis]MBP1940271.1 hypothetical protein [Jeotgalicoccus pinnipedialis]CAD2079732.1 hypothetical protein JEOPIN946_01609 [Jeotgalicoccus pinnipedialis]
MNQLLNNSFIDFIKEFSPLITIIIFILGIIFFFKRSKYYEVEYKFYKNTKYEELFEKYAIAHYIELDKNVDTFFVIGFPKYEIKNLKLYEYSSNKESVLSNKPKYELKESYTTVYPDQYIVVRTHDAEGIPPYKLKFRVNSDIIEIKFLYNGIYGTRNKNNIKAKRTFSSLLFYIIK